MVYSDEYNESYMYSPVHWLIYKLLPLLVQWKLHVTPYIEWSASYSLYLWVNWNSWEYISLIGSSV